MINSLAHVHGRQRFVTGDDSRNNWLLALVTLGEGWHNNHHAYQRSTRQGFRWWEVDVTYYALKTLSWVRVTWDLAEPPAELLRGQRRLGRAVVERVARQLADSFPAERIAAQAREAWAQTPSLEELRQRAHAAGESAAAAFGQLHLPHLPHVPHLPSAEELRQRAQEMFASTPSLDEIVQRARELLAADVAARLLASGPEPEPA
jgi:stearoyl-CoA desaturase (delta-9 desaturase)